MDIEALIRQRQIQCVYQPIVDVIGNTVVGYEALARGLNGLLPAQLFAEAEAQGVSYELDKLCLETAISSAPAQKPVFANIQPFTLLRLLENRCLRQIINRAKTLVVFEITEREQALPALAGAIEQIKKMGAKIAVDDVLQGYGRLHTIALVQPNYIKLDPPLASYTCQSYRAIAKNIITLGTDIGAEVIAERIETEGEFRTLFDLGIKLFQGYYFAAPGEEYSPRARGHLLQTIGF